RHHIYHHDLHSFPTRRSSDLGRFGPRRIASTLVPGRLTWRCYLFLMAMTMRTPDPSRTPCTLVGFRRGFVAALPFILSNGVGGIDRKSTRLNSSHVKISYAVF